MRRMSESSWRVLRQRVDGCFRFFSSLSLSLSLSLPPSLSLSLSLFLRISSFILYTWNDFSVTLIFPTLIMIIIIIIIIIIITI